MKLFTLVAVLFVQAAFAGDYDWQVRQEWSPALEKKFSEFVHTMGESGCRSLNDCLISSGSNPFYASRTPRTRAYLADCADLPFSLRMYFSWMEGLPFDYVKAVEQANPSDETNGDIRYSKNGNRPSGYREIKAGQVYDAYREMDNMRNSVSTATYRMHYNEVSDFVPAALNRSGIRPGTVAYDPSGHAAIVYTIEKDGRIRMMDAHPDNSVTRITFDEKFARSRAAHGAGLKNWRPELNRQASATVTGFSLETFNKSFVLDNQTVSYYDFVRAKMAGTLLFNPVVEVKNMISEICSNVHDREYAVNASLKANIQSKNHPDRLPRNIYGTSGEWEDYSSPSRDARLKVAFVQVRVEAQRFLTLYRAKSNRIAYKPVQSKYSNQCAASDSACYLAASMMVAYETAVAQPACNFSYRTTDGRDMKLNYTDIVNRLFKLSFDPYNCAELRWGASSKAELAACRDDENKLAWYRAEQRLRNQTERTYDARMDADVNGAASLGAVNAPDVDLWGYLAKQLKPGQQASAAQVR